MAVSAKGIDEVLSRIKRKLQVAMIDAEMLPLHPLEKRGIQQGLSYALKIIKEERDGCD